MSIEGTTEIGSLSLNEAMMALEEPQPSDGQLEEEEGVTDEGQPESEEESDVEDDESEADEESESDDEDGGEDEAEEPKALTLEIDGEQVTVTPEEVKASYMRQKDYTKKTQELAEQRKAFEAESQAVLQERQVYQQLLAQMAEQLKEPEPDWDTLRATDPIEYSLQMADWQRKQQQQSIVKQEQERLAQLQQIEQQKQLVQLRDREMAALKSQIPEWDTEKGAEVKKRVMEQGKKLGFTDDELGQAYDHRAIVALYKAAKFDEMMSKREQVKPKANSKTVKPGNKQGFGTTDVKRAKQQFERSGDIRSAVGLLNLLGKQK